MFYFVQEAKFPHNCKHIHSVFDHLSRVYLLPGHAVHRGLTGGGRVDVWTDFVRHSGIRVPHLNMGAFVVADNHGGA